MHGQTTIKPVVCLRPVLSVCGIVNKIKLVTTLQQTFLRSANFKYLNYANTKIKKIVKVKKKKKIHSEQARLPKKFVSGILYQCTWNLLQGNKTMFNLLAPELFF